MIPEAQKLKELLDLFEWMSEGGRTGVNWPQMADAIRHAAAAVVAICDQHEAEK